MPDDGLPQLRSEDELLLVCARTRQLPETSRRIQTLLRGEVDWSYLLSTAHRHRVAPLLYRCLEGSYKADVPHDALDRLRAHFHANRLRNRFLTGRLVQLIELLEEEGIVALPYKGPVIAASAYGDLALREFNDLDVLVREDDVLRAGELLASLGYRPQYRMSIAQTAAFLRYGRQYVFAREDGSVVELHWAATPRFLPLSLSQEHLYQHAVQVTLGGITVPTLSHEDLLLTLCVHGSGHVWERLAWLCDVAELIGASPDLDWERLVSNAGSLNSTRMLLLGLSLAADLLGADVPERVLRQARVSTPVGPLAAEVRERLFREEKPPQRLLDGTAFHHFHFRALERLRDRLRYCLHRATVPTLSDCNALPLPAALFPVYRLLRPAWLTGRFGQRLARRWL